MSELSVTEWIRHIQIEWGLNAEQLAPLLRVERSELDRLLAEREPSYAGTFPIGFETAAPVISIFRKLSARYPKNEDQVKWLFTEHPDFGGAKPIDVAVSSLENLYWVGYYLDSAH